MNQNAAIRVAAPAMGRRRTDFVHASHTPGARESAERPPAGYRLVEDKHHLIGLRDLVFVGGRDSCWRAARRAGELGNVRCYSVALAVAALAN